MKMLFEAYLKKSKLLSGVQKIILQRLEKERWRIANTWLFIVKPGLSMAVF